MYNINFEGSKAGLIALVTEVSVFNHSEFLQSALRRRNAFHPDGMHSALRCRVDIQLIVIQKQDFIRRAVQGDCHMPESLFVRLDLARKV